MDEPLPWDHLQSGVDRDFMEQEWQRALEQAYTPDCRSHGCQQCGLCDFTIIQPVVNEDCPSPSESVVCKNKKEQLEQAVRYRMHYSRLEDSRFYGHLEMLQLVFRVLRRAGLPVLFSRGYNPSPKVSFSQALPVGVESLAEYFDVDLDQPLNNPQITLDALNHEFPETIRVTAIEIVGKGQQIDQEATYLIILPSLDTVIQDRIAAFLLAKEHIIERVRKRKRRQLDVRPLVHSIQQEGKHLEITLVQRHGQAGISPIELLEKVFGLTAEQSRIARIKKVAVKDLQTVC